MRKLTPPRVSAESHFRFRFYARLAELMDEIRASATYLRKHHGYSFTSLAECTGLHKNSLLRLKNPAWAPDPATLRKLDKLIIRAAAKRHGETFPGETIKRGRPKAR